jgi:pimeloyl-ACP methyl ester carboxylesterase
VLGHGLSADVEQIKQLVGEIPGWQLILWDCRGHGQTEPDPTESQLGFDAFADDLRALLDHLSIRRAVIGGLSMGAGVAARYAIDHPQRADALVLMRPAWIDRPHPRGLALLERIGQLLRDGGGAEAERRLESDDELHRFAAGSPETLDGLLQQCRKPRARERAARLIVLPSQAPISDERLLGRIANLPALVTHCPQDPMHPADIAQWWAGHLRKAVLHELPSRSAPDDAHQLDVRRSLAQFLRGK